MLAGELARNSCTPNDPPTLPGILAWGRTIRALRENFVVDGWTRSDKANFSVVVNPAGDLAISVSTGDDATGDPDSQSNTKYPRGPRTVKAIRVNGQLLIAEFADFFVPVEEDDEKPRITWILLIAKHGDEIHCELKLPRSVGSDGRVEDWQERIILPTIKPGEFPPDAEDEGDAGDIDIDITRRKQR